MSGRKKIKKVNKDKKKFELSKGGFGPKNIPAPPSTVMGGRATLPPDASKTILITANIEGDVSMHHMGSSLAPEYNKHGYAVVGALETRLEVASQFPYIVLNRLGVASFGQDIFNKNMGLVQSWIGDSNKFVTYYIDDLLMHANNNIPLEFMKRAENVVVSNEILKKYVEENCYIPEARIVRTHVNYDFADSVPPAQHSPVKNEKFTLMWGSIGRIGMLFLDEVLKIMNGDPKFRGISMLCVGQSIIKARVQFVKYRNIPTYYHEAVDLAHFYGLAKTCDVILNPVSMESLSELYQDPKMQMLWLDSKCEPKFPMAGALRKPILSGHMRAYCDAIEDGYDGFLSQDPEEWSEIIYELYQNKDLCNYIGQNARKKAETVYDYKQRTLDYIKAFTMREDE